MRSVGVISRSASFWITCDREGGRLSDHVEVWAVEPVPFRYVDGDVTWVAPLDLVNRALTHVAVVDVSGLDRLGDEPLEFRVETA